LKKALAIILTATWAVVFLFPVTVLTQQTDAEEKNTNAAMAWRLLDGYLTEMATMRAEFRQILLDEHQQIVQNASGVLAIKRPGQFRWDYFEPYKQLVLSDGDRLWLYDADLEQVTVKELNATLATTPAMLLSGDAAITDGFSLLEAGQFGEVFWMTLEPREHDTDFRNISLGFVDGELQLMELEDSLDQVTRIILQSVEKNPDLDDRIFEFTPPEGADVIGDLPDPKQDRQ
jgi:outer membrane lipoprotein carrier protein